MVSTEIFYFCKDNIGKIVKVLYDKDSYLVGKVISADKYKGITISKEENFYIVGNEENKYSSKFNLDLNWIREISLVENNKTK